MNENTQVINIGYKGEVTLSIYHGDTKVKTISTHNEGKQPLFTYLAHCLAGDFVPSMVPSYLRIFDEDEHEVTYSAVPSTTLVNYDSSDSQAYVIVTFNVSSTAFDSSEKVKTFKLYSRDNRSLSSGDNPSAIFSLSDALEVASGVNLVVAWKMIIGNFN